MNMLNQALVLYYLRNILYCCMHVTKSIPEPSELFFSSMIASYASSSAFQVCPLTSFFVGLCVFVRVVSFLGFYHLFLYQIEEECLTHLDRNLHFVHHLVFLHSNMFHLQSFHTSSINRRFQNPSHSILDEIDVNHTGIRCSSANSKMWLYILQLIQAHSHEQKFLLPLYKLCDSNLHSLEIVSR